jgi:hypothetical protein
MSHIFIIGHLNNLGLDSLIRDTARLRIQLIVVVIAHDILLLIQMLEGKPKDNCRYKADDGRNGEGPSDEWIFNRRLCGEVDSVLDCRHKTIDGRDEGLHILSGARVCCAVGRHIDEDFAGGSDREWDDSPPDGDWRDERDTVGVNTSQTGILQSI